MSCCPANSRAACCAARRSLARSSPAPRSLFCDEPFSGLDPPNVARIEALLVEVERTARADADRLTSHHVASTRRMADQLALLLDGKAHHRSRRRSSHRTATRVSRSFSELDTAPAWVATRRWISADDVPFASARPQRPADRSPDRAPGRDDARPHHGLGRSRASPQRRSGGTGSAAALSHDRARDLRRRASCRS